MKSPAPTFRSRLWRFTKRLVLVSILGTVVAGASAYFGLPVLSRQPWALRKMEQAATRALGTPVEIREMEFTWKHGLELRGLSTAEGIWAPVASVEAVNLQLRYDKLLCGKLRLRAGLQSPELVVYGTETDARPEAISFPRFARGKIRFDHIDIVDGRYVFKRVWMNSDRSENVTLDHINAEGTARLENRTFRMNFSAFSGQIDGRPVTGRAAAQVAADGVAGKVEVNEAALVESVSLQDALRAAGLTLRKAGALSEPF